MNQRFSDLKKIPRAPAARMLAVAGTRLATPLGTPANASVGVVLEELSRAEDAMGAGIDMLRLMSVALPAREAIWWGCLAARDMVAGKAAEGTGQAKPPPPLAAAEAWVFKPSDENRMAARQAMDMAEVDDDTTLCALAVSMCDGKLGPGEMQAHDAPAGAVATAVLGVNLLSLGASGGTIPERIALLVDRALDIARGGDGRKVAVPEGAAATAPADAEGGPET